MDSSLSFGRWGGFGDGDGRGRLDHVDEQPAQATQQPGGPAGQQVDDRDQGAAVDHAGECLVDVAGVLRHEDYEQRTSLESRLEPIEPKIVSLDDEILVEASYSMPTAFTSIAGIESINLKVRTRARSAYSDGPVCLLSHKLTGDDKLRLERLRESNDEMCQYR